MFELIGFRYGSPSLPCHLCPDHSSSCPFWGRVVIEAGNGPFPFHFYRFVQIKCQKTRETGKNADDVLFADTFHLSHVNNKPAKGIKGTVSCKTYSV